MRTIETPVRAIAIATATAGLFAMSTSIAWAGACTETSKLGRRACFAEVRDDYLVALGKCTNLASSSERVACEDDASDEKNDANLECFAIFQARQQVCASVGEAPYDPDLSPARFLSPAQAAAHPNPYYPLVPGYRWIYEAEGEVVTVEVLDDTRVIEGVECIVVRDFVQEVDGDRGALGDPIEDTEDYYALDIDGNVWYFGEVSLSFEDGYLESIEGSWLTGRDGAKPGIVMPAAPTVGQSYRQEFLFGDAEDAAGIVSTTGSESTPAASCGGSCVVTADVVPLAPGPLENKYYKAGVGFILETVPGTDERVELVEFTQ